MKKLQKLFAVAVIATAAAVSVLLTSACQADPPPKNNKLYTITAGDVTGALSELEVSKTSAKQGETITLLVTYNANYREPEWNITNDDKDNSSAGIKPQATANQPGTFTFKMPAKNITVNVDFTVKQGIETHDIVTTVAPADGGRVLVSQKGVSGETILLTLKPEDGFEFNDKNIVTVNSIASTDSIKCEDNTFEMPDEDVIVRATFSPVVDEVPAKGPFMLYSNGVFDASGEAEIWEKENNQDADFSAEVEGTQNNGHTRAISIGPGYAEYGGGIAIPQYVDLNQVDALSLKARAKSGSVKIDYVSIGNGDYAVAYAGEDNNGIEVNSASWQRIIVPLPKRVENTISTAFSIHVGNQQGKVLYIDDIEFIETSEPVTLKSITFRQIPEISKSSPTPIVNLIRGMAAAYTVEEKTVSLVNEHVRFNKFYSDIKYTGSGAVSVSDGNVVPNGTADASFKLSVSFAGKTGELNSVLSSTKYTIIEDCLNQGLVQNPWDPGHDTNPLHKAPWYYEAVTWHGEFLIYEDGTPCLAIMNRKWGPSWVPPVGEVSRAGTWDLTGLSKITFKALVDPLPTGSPFAGYDLNVVLNVSLFGRMVSVDISDATWEDFEIELSEFPDLPTTISHWKLEIVGGNGFRGAANDVPNHIYVSEIRAVE